MPSSTFEVGAVGDVRGGGGPWRIATRRAVSYIVTREFVADTIVE